MDLDFQLLISCSRSWSSSHCRDGLSVLIDWAGQLLFFLSSYILTNSKGRRGCAWNILLAIFSTTLVGLISASHFPTPQGPIIMNCRIILSSFSCSTSPDSTSSNTMRNREASSGHFAGSTLCLHWMFKEVCVCWFMEDSEYIGDSPAVITG